MTFTGVSIRNAALDDAAAIAAIYAFHVQNGLGSFEETAPDSGEIRVRMGKVISSGLPWLVAEASDKSIVGYAYAAPFHSRAAYRFTVEDSVYVDATHLRRGVGSVLMRHLIATCESLGYREMIALIGDSANEGSIALHAKCGFSRAGTLKDVGFKFGRWVDVVLMQRRLGNAG